MDTPSLADHLRYRFDNFMSRGTVALIAGVDAGLGVIVEMVSVGSHPTRCGCGNLPCPIKLCKWGAARNCAKQTMFRTEMCKRDEIYERYAFRG